MGKRRRNFHRKYEEGKLKAKANRIGNSHSQQSSDLYKDFQKNQAWKLKPNSATVTIDYKCWRLAETALCKLKSVDSESKDSHQSQPNNSLFRKATRSQQHNRKTQILDSAPKKANTRSSTKLPEPEPLPVINHKVDNRKGRKLKKVHTSRLRTSPRKCNTVLIKSNRVKEELVRRRQISLRRRRICRALGRLRHRGKQQSAKKQLTFSRQTDIKVSNALSHNNQRCENTESPPKLDIMEKIEISEQGENMSPSHEFNYTSSSDEIQHSTQENDSHVAEDNAAEYESDMEMHVLEKEVTSDKGEDEDDDDDNGEASLSVMDDSDEESLLLSPSALPASAVFRSSKRKPVDKKSKQQPSTSRSTTSPRRLSPSSNIASSSSDHYSPSSRVSFPGKRGRGRPRKPLEDVKSVSGKLYRRKLAERLATGFSKPRSTTSASSLFPVLAVPSTSRLLAGHFADAEEGSPPTTAADPNHGRRLARWDNRSTFVYAKHKFVSNENKFRCDTCQVTFTALSSLKRHYGTIYHKQQEAAGGQSTLDLSDILRPDRRENSSEIDDVSSPLPPSSQHHRRGQDKQGGAFGRSYRRNVVGNIKKKYHAVADAARRRKETEMTSALASWYHQPKQRLKQRRRYLLPVYSSADSEDDARTGGDNFEDPFDQEDIENNFPDDELNSSNSEHEELKHEEWLSNSWKGIGPHHFTCEVCGEEFFKKLDFTAHLFVHREEEQAETSLTCPDCRIRFQSENGLETHQCRISHKSSGDDVIVPKIKRFECHRCGSAFHLQEYFQKHVLTHKRPNFRCPHCPKQFEFKFYLYDHIKQDHEEAVTGTVATTVKPKIELAVSGVKLIESRSAEDEDSRRINRKSNPPVQRSTTLSEADPALTNVPEFITCNNEEEENLEVDEDLPIAPEVDAEPIPLNDSTESVSLLQKFFQSQSDQVPSHSPEPTNSVGEQKTMKVESYGVGKVGESNGNIVIQFEPMKHSIFDDILEPGGPVDESNPCFSPLTIEIPRDITGPSSGGDGVGVGGDKKGEGDSKVGSLSDATGTGKIMPTMQFTPTKSRTLNSNPSQLPLLGCGVSYILPSKPLENALTCQDCGKTFEHRKSLVKHVQYYRQSEDFSCNLCHKSFRLKHHVSRHMKSFHNIDTNSTTSSTSGDNAEQQEDPSEMDSMNSPSGSSSGLLTTKSKLANEVSGASGCSFTRQFTTSLGDDTKKRKMSSVKSSVTKMRSMSWKDLKTDDSHHGGGIFPMGPNTAESLNCSSAPAKPASVSSESSGTSTSCGGIIPDDFKYENSYTVITDSGDTPVYKCLLCKKVYSNKHRLNSHLWYHKRASEFKCNICNAEFKFKHDLNAHHQIHDVHRVRFKCEKCPKSFSWRKDLLKHLRTKHDILGVGGSTSGTSSIDDRLSRCPFCPLIFPQDGELSKHMSEQHKKCVVCQECGQVLGSQELLDKHMEQKHEDVDEDDDDEDDDAEDDPSSPSPQASPSHSFTNEASSEYIFH